MYTEWRLSDEAGNGCTLHDGPAWCDVRDPSARLFCRLLSMSYCDADGLWRSLERSRLVERSSSHCRLVLSAPQDQPVEVSLEYKLSGGVLQLSMQATARSRPSWMALTLSARDDEHFYGLGERFDSLDQQGKTVDLQVVNGAQCGRTYKPVPFFISSAGYGLSLTTSARAVIRFAAPDEPSKVVIRVANSSLTANLYLDGAPRAILARYTKSFGSPALPPDWVFGPWKSRDWRTETQQTALEDVDAGRSHRLPGTVKLIDAAWETDSNSFVFDTEKFPRVREMIDHIHEQGYKLILWISPWMAKGAVPSEVYRYCAERGYLIRNAHGEPYVHRLSNSPNYVGSCVDFTHPEAVGWWKAQIRRLVELGVSGFKTDFGEQIPEDAVFSDGRSGRELHNLYPYLYNRATLDAVREKCDGIILGRSAWAGSQSLSLIWAGDQTSDFAPASGLPSVIIAGQSAGLSGFPFWTCDIGGYFGQPTEEAFIRWTEFAAFTPIMQIHGLGKREPWCFSDRTLATYRRYAQEHMDLFPFFYSLAREAHETGLPVMRALFLEFPDDPGVYGDTAEHEYLLGDRLLVSPVYAENDRRRVVYLPSGSWRDFWTGELRPGGMTHEIAVGLDDIPVFARAGALIPRLAGSPETLLPVADGSIRVAGPDLRLDVFPGDDGEIALADGTQFSWRDADRVLTVSNSATARSVFLRLVGLNARVLGALFVDGRTLQAESAREGGEEGGYDRIRIPGGVTCRVSFLGE